MASLATNRGPRTLILCFDGTSDTFDDDATNVLRLFSALEKERPDRQLCYYQPGIGTYLGPNRPWSSTLQRVMKVVDQALAWYLNDHVMGGYRFLMENYVKGDRICMFGFSRGAYTARCLAGMLNKVGLLPKSNEEHISFAYAKYSDTSSGNEKRASGFKEAFSMNVEVAFVGVWDTVASCGLFGRNLPFTASNRIIRVFRHALALDERRTKFRPNPWHRTAHSAKAAKNDPNQATPVAPALGEGSDDSETVNDARHNAYDKKRSTTILSVNAEACDFSQAITECDVREVWFPGSHADVGGGSCKNEEKHSLANASLVWMVNHIIDANVGVLFKLSAFNGEECQASLGEPTIFLETAEGNISKIDIADSRPASKGQVPPRKKPTITFANSNEEDSKHEHAPPVASSKKRTFSKDPKSGKLLSDPEPPTLLKLEQVDRDEDANVTMADQLHRNKIWWLLELVPLWQHYQDRNAYWRKGFRINRGRPREISDPEPLFHYSVKRRKNYTPKARVRGSKTEYVHF